MKSAGFRSSVLFMYIDVASKAVLLANTNSKTVQGLLNTVQ